MIKLKCQTEILVEAHKATPFFLKTLFASLLTIRFTLLPFELVLSGGLCVMLDCLSECLS